MESQFQIEEDCRPLDGFYPDPEQRGKVHYTFAHGFFPQYFFSNPAGVVRSVEDDEEDSTRYVQARWQMFEQRVGLIDQPSLDTGAMVFRRVTDLRAWKEPIRGFPCLFVEMPVPEHSPHAYFLGLVLMRPGRHLEETESTVADRFFTLERAADDTRTLLPNGSPGYLCEWRVDGFHLNNGTAVEPNREAFVAAVAHAL